ncbi:succinate dehydrogenase assembly factor 4, mitochondrial [Hyperolius riggenbachi]|uniref:succinate dehydrogenase assembly factor 4, mitochondrial n=1 Tax=Hyperolius riggenbachi TaxID=752182 RepID=UPI0035A30106
MEAVVRQWRRCARLMLHGHVVVRPVKCESHPWTAHNGIWSFVRAASSSSTHSNNATKPPLKKPKTPQGRFDEAEQSSMEKEPLERFPNDINPITKEKGGPRGPEPTRYGDWERKGRCIDF